MPVLLRIPGKINELLSSFHFLLKLPELKDPESYKKCEVRVLQVRQKVRSSGGSCKYKTVRSVYRKCY